MHHGEGRGRLAEQVERGVGEDQRQVGNARAADDLLQPRFVVRDQFEDAARRFMVETVERRQGRLGVEVDQQGSDVCVGAERAQIGRDRGFARPALG